MSRGERHKLSNEFLDKERTLKRSSMLSLEEEPVKLIDENPFDFGIQRKKRDPDQVTASATKAFVWVKYEDIKNVYDLGNLITKGKLPSSCAVFTDNIGIYGNVYQVTHKKTGISSHYPCILS